MKGILLEIGKEKENKWQPRHKLELSGVEKREMIAGRVREDGREEQINEEQLANGNSDQNIMYSNKHRMAE